MTDATPATKIGAPGAQPENKIVPIGAWSKPKIVDVTGQPRYADVHAAHIASLAVEDAGSVDAVPVDARIMVEKKPLAFPVAVSPPIDEAPSPAAKPSGWRVRAVRASDIESEEISWLWDGWLARGMFHLIVGEPGAGKTSLIMAMAATVSSGGRWPDGSVAKPGNVFIWSGEDSIPKVLKPRLEAGGADLSRIYFVSAMVNGENTRSFNPAKDIPALDALIESEGGAALIVIDPVVAASAADSHKNAETRNGLKPLVDLAAKFDAALIGITHFSKGTQGQSPIERVTGSLAYAALARIIMMTARGQKGANGKPGQRILVRGKSNVGLDDGGYTYELRLVPLASKPNITVSVASLGEVVEGTAREILAKAEADSAREKGGRTRREARDWLLRFLAGGPKPSTEIMDAGREEGHSTRTLRRAKDELKIIVAKTDGPAGEWVWSLPPGKNDEGGQLFPFPGKVDTLDTLQDSEHPQPVQNSNLSNMSKKGGERRLRGKTKQDGQGVQHLGEGDLATLPKSGPRGRQKGASKTPVEIGPKAGRREAVDREEDAGLFKGIILTSSASRQTGLIKKEHSQ